MDEITITIKATLANTSVELSEKPNGITLAQYDALIIKALGETAGKMAYTFANNDYEYASNVADVVYETANETIHDLFGGKQ